MNNNEIGNWQEAISSLPDKSFFNIMRLYLGEVKTPYNKLDLVSQLASFIKQEKNTNAILTLLNQTDVKILTAISLISKVSKETLIEFFKGSYSVGEIYSEVINLKERLVIYSRQDEYSDKEFLYINPFLKDAIKPYLSLKLVLPEVAVTSFSTEDIFALSPNFIAGFVSYIKVRGIACKADGTIKKNDINRLEAIFPGRLNCLQLLMNGFINLNLVKENDKGFEIDAKRFDGFAALAENVQYALLSAASVSRFSKDGLKKEAQLLLDCIASIPETGFTRESILRLAFLVGSYTEDGNAFAKKGRFSQMLAAARSEDGTDAVQNADLLDRMIDSAIEFGLLVKLGNNEEGNGVYGKGQFNSVAPSTGSEPKVLNIDSTFTVSLMPGLSLKALLPLTAFLIIKKCEVVTEFEITRQSASASFDNDWTPELIFEEMEKYTYYQLPQNLKINITEWYNSYSSATLYHGYVLKVTEGNITFAENNPKIKKYIKEKLAEGIYLLNIPVDANISSFINESGLDFLGNVKEPSFASEYTTFPVLRNGQSLSLLNTAGSQDYVKTSAAAADELLKLLQNSLAEADLDLNKKESLEHRIANRMILSEEQMYKASIKTEILEADGMDFAGKVHLIDATIKDEEMMEIQMPEADGSGKFFTMVGYPLILAKQPGEAVLRFQVEPTKEIATILVGRITHLRRLRF